MTALRYHRAGHTVAGRHSLSADGAELAASALAIGDDAVLLLLVDGVEVQRRVYGVRRDGPWVSLEIRPLDQTPQRIELVGVE